MGLTGRRAECGVLDRLVEAVRAGGAGPWWRLATRAWVSCAAGLPRAGSDYVWQSRILGSGLGFVMAATGWWFIMWLWAPIYGTVLSEEFFQPLWATTGQPGRRPGSPPTAASSW